MLEADTIEALAQALASTGEHASHGRPLYDVAIGWH
jgi:hypothetical protein